MNLLTGSSTGVGPSPSVASLRSSSSRRRTRSCCASAPVRPDLAGPTRIADTPQRQRSNGADLDLGGGGAVDPLSAGIAAALAGLGLARLRRRRR
jgi:hypothetical protein